MKRIKLALFIVVLLSAVTPSTAQSQAATCALDVTVQPGDNLSALASRHLENAQAYRQIIDATNDRAAVDASYTRIDNASVIAVGWKLCIPDLPTAIGTPVAVAPPSIVTESAVTGSVPISEAPTAATATPAPPSALPPAEVVATVDDTSPWAHRPTVDGVHPLSIEYLREQKYPGSAIAIEETLLPGSNYSRQIVSYQSEGYKILALMTVPDDEPPAAGWPTIVFNHGYIQPAIYRSDERYVAYVDSFARNGYVVFRPDYRGHGFSEGEARSAYGSPDYTIDVLNAVAAVKQHAAVDPDRIGMWGHSMGGYITLRSMVTIDDVKAGVIWAGVVASYEDLLALWTGRRTNIPARARRWRTDLIAEYGTPDENPAFWDSISANSFAADLSGPIELHHGTGDATVPLAFSELLEQEIVDAGGEVSLYVYPGDDHNITPSFGTAMARSIAFFDLHVKGK